MIGIDFCEKFVEICQNKQKNVIMGNCLKIPLKSNSIDINGIFKQLPINIY